MTRAKIIAAPVRQQYERLARQIISGTLREMADELAGKYDSTLDAFTKACDGTPYPGARQTRSVPALPNAAEQLRAVRQCLGDVADVLRAVARDVDPEARYVA